MNKLITALTAAAMAISVGVAMAAEQARGTIEAVDPATKQIVLDSGATFQLSEGVPMANLQPGQEVVVSYENRDGKQTVTRIEVKK